MLFMIVAPLALIGGGIYFVTNDGGHPVWGVIMIIAGLGLGWLFYTVMKSSSGGQRQDTLHYSPNNCPKIGEQPEGKHGAYKVREEGYDEAAVGLWWATTTRVRYRATCSRCGLNQVVPDPKTPHPGPPQDV